MAALSHPNIVSVYDVGTENGVFYIVSELVDGEPLRDAKLGLRKTLDIATQITSGLAAAHDSGIVHRDLKPENILLTRDGRAKILDFGLAKRHTAAISAGAATETMSVRTEPGTVMGTVAYMSPEQVRGLATDHRSDIFSLGVILYELLAGKRPFEGETSVDTMQAILRQDPPDLPDTVPAGVRQIVQHCLERDPVHRFQSARDLGFALSQTGIQSGVAPSVKGQSWGPRRWWITAATLAVVGISVAAGWMLRRTPDHAEWSGVLLGGPEMARSARSSPDGHLVAFLAVVDGLTQVALMKPESGNWSILTHKRDRGLTVHITWSPDGTVIYYDRATDAPAGVYSVPVLGGEERLILENAVQPEALPDGSMLVRRFNSEHQMQMARFWPESGRLQDLPLLMGGYGLDDSGIRVMPDGTEAFAVGRPSAQPGEPKGLYAIDLASGRLRRITPPGHSDEAIRAIAVTRDGRSVLIAMPAGRMLRISSIPTHGPFRQESLFSVTSDVQSLDVSPDGSVYLDLLERPAKLVRFGAKGGPTETIAKLKAVPTLDMLLVLPDGRVVVPSVTSGRDRLVVVAKGSDPVTLVNTPDETAPPMTMAGPNAIAFSIGPAPRQTIAVAGISSGGIARRIAPNKGTIDSLTSSLDGETLYFAAGGTLWSIPTAGGEARKIGTGGSALMEPSGLNLVVERRDDAGLRIFRLPVNGGPEREIPLDRSLAIYSPFLAAGALDGQGRLLVSLQPRDSYFSPPAIFDFATGRITRVPSDNLSDLEYPVWTADGRITAIQLALESSIWRFHQEGK